MLWAGVAAVSLAAAGLGSGDVVTHASTAFMVAATVGGLLIGQMKQLSGAMNPIITCTVVANAGALVVSHPSPYLSPRSSRR
jgi:hypothetical protein